MDRNNQSHHSASGLTIGTLAADISAASFVYNTNAISLQYTVVPEPATWALLAAGLTTLVVLRRRRKS